MRVTAVQFEPSWGDRPASIARLVPLARKAATGADLVVMPEMASTGYMFESAAQIGPHCEPARGELFAALSPIAKASGAFLVCGFAERDGDALFNSALVIDPHGELAFVYRKTLLYSADTTWARPGDSGYRRIDADWGSFGVGICMDINDDAFTGWCSREDPDVVAFPTNWVEEGIDVWQYWAWRMLDVRGALVAANRWGGDGAVQFSGRSAVMQDATIYAAAQRAGDQVIRATLESR